LNRQTDKFIQTLQKGLKELRFDLSKVLHLYESYYRELKRFSKAYNLTSLEEPAEFAIKGVLDSLLYLRFIPEGAISLLDVGSGAGLPGVVLKIARPELYITLIEPSRKRATFLRHIIYKLALNNIEVIEDSLEGFSRRAPSKFQIILTRALFRLYEFVKKTAPLVGDDTLLLLSKGPKYEEEIEELRVHYDITDIETFPVRLPLTGITRYFILIRPKSKRPEEGS
jgi:16S rRNA (guanine527-N7)-methyltransferase